MAIAPTDTSTILAYEQKLIGAYKTANIETINGLYHDNLVFNSPNGQVLSKTDDIGSMSSGMLKIREYTPGDYTIKITENLATVSVSIYIKAKIADNEIEGNFRFLRVWIEEDDKWKVIAISGYQVK